VIMRVYSRWDSSLLNIAVKFFLTNYLLYVFLLRRGGEVSLETLHLLKDQPEDGLVIRPKHVAKL